MMYVNTLSQPGRFCTLDPNGLRAIEREVTFDNTLSNEDGNPSERGTKKIRGKQERVTRSTLDAERKQESPCNICW